MTSLPKVVKDSINNLVKTISPNRTPPRSRANSIGGSLDDPDAPPTQEKIQEMLVEINRVLEETGFIEAEATQAPLVHTKVTAVRPT